MSTYVTKNYWVLDKDNNVILGNDDNTGISNTESSECDAYTRESDSTELLDYIPYNPFFLLDDKNNVILKDDDTGIILNYGESLSDHDYTAFAVYSDTDNSLIFYYDVQPQPGSIYNKRTVTTIYTGWDTTTYTSASSVPWYYVLRFTLKSVSFDKTFFQKVFPVSMAYWFYGFTNDVYFNFDNLDTRYTTNMTSTFNGCSSITTLDLRSFDTSNVTSYSNFAVNCNSLEEVLLCSSFDLFAKSSTALVSEQYWHEIDTGNEYALPDYLIGLSGDMTCVLGQGKNITFAIYSSDDNSLMFYSDIFTNIPSIGDTYNNRKVTDIFNDIESIDSSGTFADVPWDDYRRNILLVKFDESFKDARPISTRDWFTNFENCTSFDFTYLDTSDVYNMRYMFYNCSSVTKLDLSNFNTSKVTDMVQMFEDCSSLESVDVSSFNTSKVESMGIMFSGCSSLTTLDVSNFDTSNVTNLVSMFSYCDNLVSVNVSGFDTKNVTNMLGVFYYDTSLTTIYSDNDWDVSSIEEGQGTTTFSLARALVGGNGTAYSTSYQSCEMAKIDNSSHIGYFTQNTITAFAIYSEDDNSFTFYSNTASNVPNVGNNYNGKKVTNIYTGMDKDMYGAIEPWYDDLRNSIKTITFDSSFKNVQPLYTMYWFYGLSSCTSITNLSNLDTSKLQNAMFMFYGCSGITELDISSFDTSSLTNTQMMFYNCTNLKTIYSNDNVFKISGISNDSSMFTNCTSIVGGNGTTYSSSKVDSSMAHVDTSSNPGYFTAK